VLVVLQELMVLIPSFQPLHLLEVEQEHQEILMHLLEVLVAQAAETAVI
jgi:hypothetical protein